MREPVYEFDYLRDPAGPDGVHETYWRLKREAPPVFWTSANGGHWVVVSADAAIEVLRDPGRFSNRYLSIPPNPAQPKMIPEGLDPPEHRAYRQLLRPFFERQSIDPLAPRIRAWAEEMIGAVADKGECEFVEALGSRFPISIFMELFGFPLEKFDLFRDTVVGYFNAQTDHEERMRLGMVILGIINDLINERRAAPRQDLMSTLVHIDFEDRKLTHEELMSIGFLMFLAGLDTVVNALSFGMRHLAGDKALRRTLIEHPERAPDIVEELMRAYTFVSTPRYITQDTVVSGVQMREGESVLVPLAMIGWDEKTTSCPHEVRVDRGKCQHAGFGLGIHTCLGNYLARLEMTTFYQVWAERIGHFRQIDKGPLRYRAGSVQAIEALHLAWEVNARNPKGVSS